MSDRLTLHETEPGTEVKVTASYLNGSETAVVDEDGVLRDSKGNAYSEYSYYLLESRE